MHILHANEASETSSEGQPYLQLCLALSETKCDPSPLPAILLSNFSWLIGKEHAPSLPKCTPILSHIGTPSQHPPSPSALAWTCMDLLHSFFHPHFRHGFQHRLLGPGPTSGPPRQRQAHRWREKCLRRPNHQSVPGAQVAACQRYQ